MTIYLYVLFFIGFIRSVRTVYTMGKYGENLSKSDKWPEAFGVLIFNCIIAIPPAYFLIAGF